MAEEAAEIVQPPPRQPSRAAQRGVKRQREAPVTSRAPPVPRGPAPSRCSRVSAAAGVAKTLCSRVSVAPKPLGPRVQPVKQEALDNFGMKHDSRRLGAWSDDEKEELVRLVKEMEPCGAADWEVCAQCCKNPEMQQFGCWLRKQNK